MRFSVLAVAVLAVALAPVSSARADAFAAATGIDYDGTGVEQGSEWCRRNTLSGAKSCAKAACERAADQDCELTVWCEPGSWTGVVVMERAGSSKHVAVCEKASRNAALRALKDACRAYRKDKPSAFQRCKVDSLISPDAETSERNVVTWKYKSGDIKQ